MKGLNVKAYLFDLDGTLADSMPVWRDKMFGLLALQHIDPPEGLLQEITPLGDSGTLQYFREHFRLSMSEEEMRLEMDRYAFPRYCKEIPAKDGVFEYLKMLKDGGSRLYLLTASPRRMFEPCLKRQGLLPFFERTWCCEDFHMVKNNPAIYAAAAAEMKTSPREIAFFDDNKAALLAAKAAGLFTVGVYDESSARDEEEIRGIADLYIRSFKELL